MASSIEPTGAVASPAPAAGRARAAVCLASILSPIMRICSRRRADEGEAVRLDDLGEAGVLRQEAVAGMDRVGAGDGRGREDRRDVEIAVARRRRADADASSARRTCMASASAVECTATVLMPISWQARWMRSAISPRLAIRTFSNIVGAYSTIISGSPNSTGWRVVDQDLRDRAGLGRLDRVHHLHRLDDQQRLARRHLVADRDEGAACRARATDRRCRPSAT